MQVDFEDIIKKLKINQETIEELLIGNIQFAIETNSCGFAHYEVIKATLLKEIEQTKLDYKLWLSDKKKELDRKIYNSEMAKEDGVIAKYRTEYMAYNKKIIDLTYQLNVVTGLARAYEMRANLLISLQSNKEEQKQKKVEDWNKKIEQTKI